MNGSEGRFTPAVLRMSAGILVWAAHFTVIYALAALGCARGYAHSVWLGASIVTWTIVAATLMAAAAAVFFAWPAFKRGMRTFEDSTTATVAGLALLAIVWEGWVPVFVVPACG